MSKIISFVFKDFVFKDVSKDTKEIMAVAEAHIKAHENLGQGLFGVQLEVS
jgi:hypothetical protein